MKLARYRAPEGLPGPLPPGERVLWQGRPDWRGLARGPYLGAPVAAYFAALTLWRLGDALASGAGVEAAAAHALWMALVGAAALGVICLLAWASARASLYTITDRRVVMRVGAALTLSVNLPFARIVSADLRRAPGGRGEIALTLEGGRASWFLLWPHLRPWRLSRPEPALRALPDAERAAAILAGALAAHHGTAPKPVAAPDAPAARPALMPAE